jgi:predicted O-methyltransferase YrrM
LADAVPDATIYTIDLPDECFTPGGWFTTDMVGSAFVDNPEYDNRIVQMRVDLDRFDPGPYRSSADLVFVDSGHDYESVKRDSRLALELLAPGGCVIWDDYSFHHWDSVLALNALAASVPLVRVAGTRFVSTVSD